MRTNPKASTQKFMFSETLKEVLRKPNNRHERRVLAKLNRK